MRLISWTLQSIEVLGYRFIVVTLFFNLTGCSIVMLPYFKIIKQVLKYNIIVSKPTNILQKICDTLVNQDQVAESLGVWYIDLRPIILMIIDAHIESSEIMLWFNSISDYRIATKFCTCHDSCAVVTCAKLNCNALQFEKSVCIQLIKQWKIFS